MRKEIYLTNFNITDNDILAGLSKEFTIATQSYDFGVAHMDRFFMSSRGL